MRWFKISTGRRHGDKTKYYVSELRIPGRGVILCRVLRLRRPNLEIQTVHPLASCLHLPWMDDGTSQTEMTLMV
jgi:hypothetical protein